jgi:hypothetical protein
MTTRKNTKPIFLLGVGRCGSTALQLQLSRIADIWIWGEHDGVLRGFLDWTRSIRESRNLQQFAFSRGDADPRQLVTSHTGGDATHIAWMNAFGRKDVEAIERSVIETLCARNLPEGKRRWGFKEIRYGIEDDVPERLLGLYPDAKIVHTLRDPYKTIESSIFAWHYDELKAAIESDDIESLRKTYRHYASRWTQAVEYFDALRSTYPGQVHFSRIERLAQEQDELLKFLEVRAKASAELGETVNPGQQINVGDNAAYLSQLRDLRGEFAEKLAQAAKVAGYEHAV